MRFLQDVWRVKTLVVENGATGRISRWLIDSFPIRRFSQLEILPLALYWSPTVYGDAAAATAAAAPPFSNTKMVKQIRLFFVWCLHLVKKKRSRGGKNAKDISGFWARGHFLCMCSSHIEKFF